ncbi:MAG: matrixin family metalloprotease, partial [Pedobacter sp.]
MNKKIIFVISFLLLSNNAYSFRNYKCGTLNLQHTSKTVQFSFNTTSFPFGSAARGGITSAMGRWNVRSDFAFSNTEGTAASASDTINSIWWSAPANFPGGNAANTLARTRYTYNMTTCRFNNIDIIFNNSFGWNYSEALNHTPFSAAAIYNIHGVALHELGHALGLDHEERYYNTMGDSFSHLNFDATHSDYTPGEDATAGAISLYSESTIPAAPEDGITMMVRDAALSPTTPNSYSVHTQGVITDNSNNVIYSIPNTGLGPNRRYQLARGQIYKIPITLETNGANTHNRLMWAKLSSDRTFDSSDTAILD